MGGHQSTQSVNTSAKLAASVVQSATQSCINIGSGSNIISFGGNNNVVDGVNQTVSVSVNSNCQVLTGQDSTFQAALASAATSTLDSQQVAMTQWMDNSHTDQSTSISNQLNTNLSQATAQTCLNQLAASNQLQFSGSGNVVKNIAQNATMDVISNCLMKNGQTNTMVSDITNTVNQHAQYKSENPFAFITDAITAVAKNITYTVALVFIAIVCFVVLYEILKHSGRRRRAAAAAVGSPAAATGPAPAVAAKT